MKIGGVYYRAWVCEGGKIDIDAYVLRTLRGRFGYLVAKNEWTWVKTGHGNRATWGWAERVDAVYRDRFLVGNGIPPEYARSKTQAVRVQIRKRKQLARKHPETDPEIISEDARDLAALERRLKHETRKAA